MKQTETTSNQTTDARQPGSKFTKVLDGRKQPIRGLWVRNGRYYAQLQFKDKDSGKAFVKREPLFMDKEKQNPVTSRFEAEKAMHRLQDNRSAVRRCPKLRDYVVKYLAWIEAGSEQGEALKRPNSIIKERSQLKLWCEFIGDVPLNHIRMTHINDWIAKRLRQGKSKRTIKLDIFTLNNVLNHAVGEGFITDFPKLTKSGRQRLKSIPAERAPFETSDLEALCTAAMDTNEDGTPITQNWLQFCDYIRLLAYSGAREREALKLRWDRDVDFKNAQLIIGNDGDTKNKTARKVDFNERLRLHLLDMQKRKVPDSEWMFPSPKRGDKDLPTKTLRKSLLLVREHAAKKDPKLATKAFHDLRHLFASICVRAGVDFKTVSRWLGHRDGGYLVCKVYSHLTDEHTKEKAKLVRFDSPKQEKGTL